jgi:hypothetical protein
MQKMVVGIDQGDSIKLADEPDAEDLINFVCVQCVDPSLLLISSAVPREKSSTSSNHYRCMPTSLLRFRVSHTPLFVV